MWHFKIIYVPKQSILFDSARVEQYKDGFVDGMLANEVAKDLLKARAWEPDYHLISVRREYNRNDLKPTQKQLELIKKVDEEYSFIDIYKDVRGNLHRKHNTSMLLSGTTVNDAEFLKKWYPEFNIGWSHQMFYNVFFNKVDNWAELKLPSF